jgi:serine/threonine-protein kinase
MLEPGTLVGRYQIERRLGRGGMGTLYVAKDPVLARSVALKLFLGDIDSADYRERFAREARAVAALNHPNIVTVHDYGEFAAQPFIVMELIDGHTLADLNASAASIPLGERLRWIEELCAGVAFVHRQGIIHRDIKPSNAMIDRTGRLKLLDFGIARVGSTPSASVTGPLGSPGYMAPEQISGGSIDHRADIFAIGAVSYELLASVPAFGGAPFEQIHKILNAEPPPLSVIEANLPADLSEAIMRALAKNAASRFPDAESLGAIVSSIRRRLEVDNQETDAGLAPRELDRGLAPTVVRPRAAPRGRERLSAEDGGAAPPGTPRPGRETWSRRRAERIAAILQEAKTCLESGQLEQARDACEQALTIDETHQEGLALYERVKAALANREALGHVADAQRELARGEHASAAAFLQRARTVVPEMPEALRLERDLKLARVEVERTRKRKEMLSEALLASESAVRRADPEAALLHAREALDLEPENTAALNLEESAMRLLNRDVDSSGTVLPTLDVPGQPFFAPARTGNPPVGEPAGQPTRHDLPDRSKPAGVQQAQSRAIDLIASMATRVSQAVRGFSSSLEPWLSTTKLPPRRWLGGIALAVAASVVVAVTVATWRSAPVPAALPAGTLVIDAVPWATVTAIVDEDGRPVALPDVTSTPLSLDVPAGAYRVSLQGPPPQEDARQVEVTVVAGQTLAVPRLEFSTLTPEEYFEPYLGSPNDGTKP